MVVVTNDPYLESEPMLQIDDIPRFDRRGSYAEAYKNLASSMKADPLQIQSPKLACDLLLTATKLKNIPLVKQCVEVLDSQIKKENVLNILIHLRKFQTPATPLDDFEPSAPPIVEDENQCEMDLIQQLTENLRNNCFLEIDKYADDILRNTELLDLSYSDLLQILTRDTLQVSSETIVYSAVMKWAKEECRRRKLQAHVHNLRAVLRELSHAPRYGLMSKKEFTYGVEGEKSPMKSGILDEMENKKVLFYIKERQKNRHVEELPYKASRYRVIGHDKPKILSSFSSIRAAECPVSEPSRCTNQTTCERFVLNLLTCWAAVFD